MNLRRHLTYANVVSTLCLFLLLGGAAFAGTQLSKGSVGTNALKGEAVTKAKLAPNSVNSKKVVDDSLTGEDIAARPSARCRTRPTPNTPTRERGSANSASTAQRVPRTTPTPRRTRKSSTATRRRIRRGAGRAPRNSSANSKPELYFSVSGNFGRTVDVEKRRRSCPSRKFRATDFAVRLEGEAQAGVNVHVSLVVNGADHGSLHADRGAEHLHAVDDGVEIPPGAQVAWKIVSAAPVAARPQFALRLAPS